MPLDLFSKTPIPDVLPNEMQKIINEIRLRWTHIWYISPHQYVQVKIDDKWINVDIWANAYGIEFGDNAHGFH